MKIKEGNRYTNEFKSALESDIENGLSYGDVITKYNITEVSSGLRQLYSKLSRRVHSGEDIPVMSASTTGKSKLSESGIKLEGDAMLKKEGLAHLAIDDSIKTNVEQLELSSKDVKSRSIRLNRYVKDLTCCLEKEVGYLSNLKSIKELELDQVVNELEYKQKMLNQLKELSEGNGE